MKKSNLILIITAIILVILIFLINLSLDEKDSEDNSQENYLSCIYSKAKLYTSRECEECSMQKNIILAHLDKLTIIDCTTANQDCINKKIRKTPTWEINNQLYPGIKSIAQLKQLTGC
ncbi:MAG: hypothetical protein KKF56_03460 [Nanoarchaeota archaeon]|nr:hypothetical protein [Nanoarchaeota archaeon]